MIVKTLPTYPHLIKINNHQNSYGQFNDFGVSHDLNKHLQFTLKSKRLKSEIVSKLKGDFLFDRTFTTFLFLASGHEKLERFAELPYNNIICIDYQILDYQCLNISYNQRIYTLPIDVITGLSILTEIGVLVDILCDNNDGANLGFGPYSTFSQLVLSAGLPCFNKEKLLVVGSRQYQKINENYQIARKYLKLGYSNRIELKSKNDLLKHNLAFNQNIITLYPHSSAGLDFYLLENRIEATEKLFSYKGKAIHIVQGNIFEYIHLLDMALLIFRSKYQYTHFKNNFPNIYDSRGKYRIKSEIFDFNRNSDLAKAIEMVSARSIGFIPQNNKNTNWLDVLNSMCQTNLTDIYFFHIDKNDFKQLYHLLL